MNSFQKWHELVQKKEAWLILLLCVVSFGTFRNFPFEATVFLVEAPLLLLLSAFAVVYFIRRFQKRRHLNALEWIILLLSFMPLYSAVNAWMSFGQPIWYGLAAERRWLRIFVVLLFYVLISDRRLSWNDVVRIFLIVAGIHVVVHVLGYVLVQALYDKPWTTPLFTNPTDRGLRFRAEDYFLVWLLIYAVTTLSLQSFRKARWWLIPVIGVVSYFLFIVKGRSQIALISLVIVLMVLTLLRGRRLRMASMVISIVVLVEMVVTYLFKPAPLLNTAKSFERIWQTVCVLNEENRIPSYKEARTRDLDVSTLARITQIQTTMDYMNDEPILWIIGTGRLSRHWHAGFNGKFTYLYPVDIGWMGIVFLYGLLGFMVVNMPYLLGVISWMMRRGDVP